MTKKSRYCMVFPIKIASNLFHSYLKHFKTRQELINNICIAKYYYYFTFYYVFYFQYSNLILEIFYLILTFVWFFISSVLQGNSCSVGFWIIFVTGVNAGHMFSLQLCMPASLVCLEHTYAYGPSQMECQIKYVTLSLHEKIYIYIRPI